MSMKGGEKVPCLRSRRLSFIEALFKCEETLVVVVTGEKNKLSRVAAYRLPPRWSLVYPKMEAAARRC